MATPQIYDAKAVSVIIGGRPLKGFAPDTKVSIAPESDLKSKVVGTDGEVVISKINDDTAIVTISMLSSSPDSDYLYGLVATDQINQGISVFNVFIRDSLSGRTHEAPESVMWRLPDQSYTTEQPTLEFQILCVSLLTRNPERTL